VRVNVRAIGRRATVENPPHRDAIPFSVMHELSIALSLIDAVCDELPRLGRAATVRSVRIRLGPQAGVVAEALRFAFEVAAADSPLAGARLEIERTSGCELALAALEVVDGPEDCRGSQEHPETE
jgi:Zn finger protein HypA/HybF involved in hydrogenase expression